MLKYFCSKEWGIYEDAAYEACFIHDGLLAMLISERLVASRFRTRCPLQSPCRCSSQPSTKGLATALHELFSHHNTYQRPQQVFLVLLKLPQRILVVPCALDDLGGAVLANILQDCLHLVESWGVLGDVQLKWVAASTGIVDGIHLGARGCLLQQTGHSHRGWRARLVEERDYVEGLALHGGPR